MDWLNMLNSEKFQPMKCIFVELKIAKKKKKEKLKK